MMGPRDLCLILSVISLAAAQSFKVCVSSSNANLCQSLDKDGSQAVCERVESRIDCALKLARGEADVGYFTEEELFVLAQQQPTDNRLVATVRDVSRTTEPYSFEAVVVVRSNHIGGLEGLRQSTYCHPGLNDLTLRWSPRVLKGLELTAVRSDQCTDLNVSGKTPEQIEVEEISAFFSSACRPGTWSTNATVDATLKSGHPSLCSRCGGSNCVYGYNITSGVAGVNVNNAHIQALECARVADGPSVAYVAWQHVREYFTHINASAADSFSLLCPNGTLAALTPAALTSAISPCAFVRQPWGAIVASTTSSSQLLTNLRTWYPTGADPGGNTWQSVLFSALANGGGASSRIILETAPQSISNYTDSIRPIQKVDEATSCIPPRRWCTISNAELTKCRWVRTAAFTLGLQPIISCVVRENVLDCLNEIQFERADFISSPSNYGYIARQRNQLTPVKMVQNQRGGASRVAAFVKTTAAAQNITRFENLRGKKACFPEYGGLAYVAFVRTAQERGVISESECDYAKAVGEFFDGACAPGAIDVSHALSATSSYNATNLCTVCQSTLPLTNFTCAWNYTNQFFGNNGTLACLADPSTDVAILNVANISEYISNLRLQPNDFQALCRNNSLALSPGINVDDGCLLAHVVDAEILTRRSSTLSNALSTLLDSLDYYFGYSAASGTQLVNLEIFSPFDGVSHLLFKDSTIGLTEPSQESLHEPAKNYIDLFNHLQSCTNAAPEITTPGLPGMASRTVFSFVTLAIMTLLTRFVVY